MSRPRVVILGGGFGGAYCARALAKRMGRDIDLRLIDRHNYFIFYPLLVEAGTGSLEPRHAVVPIRDFLPRGEFRMGEVRAIDPSARRVEYELIGATERCELSYDHLVIAMGSVTRMPDIPGVREHCREMKSLADAVAMRDRAVQLLELASATESEAARREMLRFVVIGGNFTGVEVAGELDEFLRAGARRYGIEPSEAGVTLVELADRLLAPLGPDLAEFARTHLVKRGIDVHLSTTVDAVDAGGVTLSTGRRVAARSVICCAGIRQNPMLPGDALPADERGYLRCTRELRVEGFEDVWAIGDCAVNVDADGAAYPATAQHALRQGTHLARNIAAVLRGEPARPCNLVSQGALAALGCRTGVARVFGVKLSGFPAWWLWRTVYLMKMPRLARKVRVALDWTIDLLFRRDYVQLSLHRSPEASDK